MRKSRWKDDGEEGKERRRKEFKGEALELTEESMRELGRTVAYKVTIGN